MGKALRLISTILAFTVPAQASETLLTGKQITEALAGHTYRHADITKKVEQIFLKSGDTFYVENGAQSQGRWDVRGDKYCSQWPPSETWVCYAVANDGEILTFVSKHGARFPVTKVN